VVEYLLNKGKALSSNPSPTKKEKKFFPHYVAQAGLKLTTLPASAENVLGFKVCATMPSSKSFFTNKI
jgi:hypothetical protein